MFALYKESHPPTCVDSCIKANFTSSSDVNLIVTRSHVLEVYKLIDGEAPGSSSLELVAHYKLEGNIESVSPARFPGFSKDCLLLSFLDAKVSVIEFDASVNDIRTVSLHFFEDEALKEGRIDFSYPPELRVDPRQRCAAMLAYDTVLMAMPFRAPKAEHVLLEEDSLRDVFGGFVQETQEKLSEVQSADELPVQKHVQVNLRELGILNVKDYCFLEGYFEPTLLILHEPNQTTAGRLPVRWNTCILTAISLSFSGHASPIIWSCENLPSDSFRLVPLPQPTVGALVIGVNTVLHVNQKPTYGMCVNKFGRTDSDCGIAIQSSKYNLELDGSECTFLAPNRLLFSLRNGDLHIMHLFVDGRSVRHIEITKAGTSVLVSCMCALTDDHLFLGSRLGDSLLVQFSEKTSGDQKSKSQSAEDDAPPSKRRRTTGGGSGSAAPGQQSQEVFVSAPEEESIDDYSALLSSLAYDSKDAFRVVSYTFRVRDSLLNIGPIADMIVADTSDGTETGERGQHIVTCSGFGKNGSLCSLQRSIHPEVVMPFDLPACRGVWTLKHIPEDMADSGSFEHDALLVISSDEGTMVLETGEQLQEITDRVDFRTDVPTVSAGNLDSGRRIVQITRNEIRLLHGVTLMHQVPLEVPVHYSHIADPNALLLLTDGSLRVVHLNEARNELVVTAPELSQGYGKVTAACLYNSTPPDSVFLPQGSPPATVGRFCVVCWSSGAMEVYSLPAWTSVFLCHKFGNGYEVVYDGGARPVEQLAVRYPYVEEILLARLGDRDTNPFLFVMLSNRDVIIYRSFAFHAPSSTSSTSMMVTTDGGSRLSHLRFQKIQTDFFARDVGGQTAVPTGGSAAAAQSGAVVPPSPLMPSGQTPVTPRARAPSISQSGQIPATPLVTQPFAASTVPTTPGATTSTNTSGPQLNPASDQFFPVDMLPRWPSLVYFSNVGECKGVFVCGTKPAWAVADRGQIRVHPMSTDSAATAFTPFHNVHCPNGFVFFVTKGMLKICQLPAEINYKAPWPTKKIPLKSTPHHIAYHQGSRAFIVSTSQPTMSVDTPPMFGEMDAGASLQLPPPTVEQTADQDLPIAFEDKHELRMFAANTWKEMDRLQLEQFERVLCVKVLNFSKKEITSTNKSDYSPLVAVGTGYVMGEDNICRGRIILLNLKGLLQVNEDKTIDMSVVKFEKVFEKSFSSPVTAIAQLEGFMVASIGPKVWVYYYDWDMNQLVPASFWDAQFYGVSLNVIKNYVLLGDVARSVHFLKWREPDRSLTLLGKDFEPLHVYSSEFLVDGPNLGLVVADDENNIQIFNYSRETSESLGGTKLLARADFHVGAPINKFLRLKMRSLGRTGKPGRQCLYFGTTDGGIGLLAPLDEQLFKRLQVLQNRMITDLPQRAGLHPKAFRIFRTTNKRHHTNKKHVIDGDLLWRFASLDVPQRRDLARKTGTTAENVTETLVEIDANTFQF